MRGIPGRFNTEQDVANSLAENPEATKAKLRELLDARLVWFPVRKLSDGETGQEDATHKVVMQSGDMADGQIGPSERRQYELREDGNAWLFRIGLSVAKAQAYHNS